MSDALFNFANNFNFYYPQPNQDKELIEQLGFIPGLKEFLILRQVHALEHATVWILSNISNSHHGSGAANSEDNKTLGGLSTDRGFYLYGELDPLKLKPAVNLALARLQRGEWNLALHPRCGTNSSVAILLTASMAMTAHFLLPREPLGQLLGLGVATTAATHLAPELGMLVQKYITTAVPFNLKLDKIFKTKDIWDNSAYFVQLQWQS